MITIRRFPLTKSLRIIQLGLAFGLFTTLVHLFIPVCTANASLLQVIILAAFLIFGSTLGGWFAILIFVMWGAALWPAELVQTHWLYEFLYTYIIGFSSGALVALFYNDGAYILTRLLRKSDIKISAFYDKNRTYNILKSPKKDEWTDKWKNMAEDEQKRETLSYYYKKDFEPERPYTITFVANPIIWYRTEENDQDGKTGHYIKDPIIENKDLFIKAVDDAMRCFENDAVLGHPDIWPKIRIATIFDERHTDFENDAQVAKHIIARPLEAIAIQDGVPQPDNIIEPVKDAREKIASELRNYPDENSIKIEKQDEGKASYNEIIKRILSDTDVYMILSASTQYIRPTAYPSSVEDLSDSNCGANFSFEIPGDLVINAKALCSKACHKTKLIQSAHEKYAAVPGIAAINVLSATSKTYIHEFAHIMSAARTGAIVDEYYDDYCQDSKTTTAESLQEEKASNAINRNAFYINKLERSVDGNQKKRPIPRVFAIYNGCVYYSDREHPSEKEDWNHYFPARTNNQTSCIMDGYGLEFKFDDLLSQFMYDRLKAKVNR
jgi:hypothetical protein